MQLQSEAAYGGGGRREPPLKNLERKKREQAPNSPWLQSIYYSLNLASYS